APGAMRFHYMRRLVFNASKEKTNAMGSGRFFLAKGAAMTLMILAMVLPWLLLGLGSWLGYQLLLQNGRVVLRLEMLEKQIRQLGALLGGEADSPQGLPIGTAAPEFELPDLAAQPWKLSQFRGRRVLLIFFNPKCGYCEK